MVTFNNDIFNNIYFKIHCLYNAKTEEEAKKEFKEILEDFLEGEIDYYRELCSMLDELKWTSSWLK